MAAAADRHQAVRVQPDAKAPAVGPAAFAVPRFGAEFRVFERGLQALAVTQLWQSDTNFYTTILKAAVQQDWIEPEAILRIEESGICHDALVLANEVLDGRLTAITQRIERFVHRYFPEAELSDFLLIEPDEDENNGAVLDLSTCRMELVALWATPRALKPMIARVIRSLLTLGAPFVTGTEFLSFGYPMEAIEEGRHYLDRFGADALEEMVRDICNGDADEGWTWCMGLDGCSMDEIRGRVDDVLEVARIANQEGAATAQGVRDSQSLKSLEDSVKELREQRGDVDPDWYTWFRMAFAAMRYVSVYRLNDTPNGTEPGYDYQPFGADSVVLFDEALLPWVEEASQVIQQNGEPFMEALSCDTPEKLVANLSYIQAMLLTAAVVYLAQAIDNKGESNGLV